MSLPTEAAIGTWVAKHIGEFHRARLCNLKDLNLRKVLARKNPYLFKAKNVLDLTPSISPKLG
ncbi:MAG: PmeII family type II restriction endonuclease [Rudaea sp.]